MTTMDRAYGPKLELGRVFQQIVQVIGRQPVIILGLSLLLAGLPTAINLHFMNHLRGAAMFASGGYWFRGLISLFVSAFLEACLFFTTFSELSGRRASPVEILTNGGKFFLRLFAVNLFFFLAVGLGLILLVVPGLMLALAWCVAGPALVVERLGITDVFGRSAELTRDNRWRLLGLAVIIAVVSWILQKIAGIYDFGSMGPDFTFFFSPTRLVLAAILNTFMTAIWLVGLAVVYVELRGVKEGLAPASLATVFD